MKIIFAAVVATGVLGALFFGYFTFVDFALLRAAYAQLLKLSPSVSTQTILLIEAQQNAHRINVFADGTWALLSAIFAALGVLGLAILRR